MSEQLKLFSLPSWAETIWQTLDPDKRREIVSLLAEMGRCALAAKVARNELEVRRES